MTKILNKNIINYNKKGLPHGYQKGYYSNGNLCYEGNFNNGKANGYWEIYYEDGSIKSKKFYL